MCNPQTDAHLQLIEAQAQVKKLQAFKDFVHTTLDKAGVDKHEEQNATTGCRVGARLADLIALAATPAAPAPVEAGGCAGLPANFQELVLLAAANDALRRALGTLDLLMPICLKKLNGDELQAVYSTYHEVGKVADRIRPVVKEANDKAVVEMAKWEGGQDVA